ncbi:MAG: hypothetical protein Q4C49_00655 [Bacillota bacterium]|nr:hypothetical protein [Bacillota bacterium]
MYKLQALIAIAKFKDTLEKSEDGSPITIGALRTISTLSGENDMGMDTERLLKAYQLLSIACKEHPDEMVNPE